MDCDAALCLLPKMARCLFRRSCVLLEMGKPDLAVAALETLYRIDRAWPKLSEHLLRAHAALRRKNKADKKGEAASSEDSEDDDSEGSEYYTSDEDDKGSSRRREKNDRKRKAKQANAESHSP